MSIPGVKVGLAVGEAEVKIEESLDGETVVGLEVGEEVGAELSKSADDEGSVGSEVGPRSVGSEL